MNLCNSLVKCVCVVCCVKCCKNNEVSSYPEASYPLIPSTRNNYFVCSRFFVFRVSSNCVLTTANEPLFLYLVRFAFTYFNRYQFLRFLFTFPLFSSLQCLYRLFTLCTYKTPTSLFLTFSHSPSFPVITVYTCIIFTHTNTDSLIYFLSLILSHNTITERTYCNNHTPRHPCFTLCAEHC